MLSLTTIWRIAYMEKGEFTMAVESIDKAVSLGYDVAPQDSRRVEGLPIVSVPLLSVV